jgi:Ca-activated chloride channel family protein
MKTILTPLLALCACLAAPVASAGPVSLDASLRNGSLPETEGETYLRVTVRGQPVHLDTRQPMNLAVVIDRSGSMSESGPSGSEKMKDAISSARFLVDQLSERDTLTIISFDDGAEVLFPGVRMTKAAQASAKERLGTLFARGGTDMIAGLGAGIGAVKEHQKGDAVNRVILISDGIPNVAEGLVDLARGAQGKGIGVSTLGVGVDYNEDLMTSIANAGNGGYYFVADASRLPGIFQRELHSLMAVVARNAALKIEFGSGVKPVKVYGYDAQIGAESTLVRLGDVVGGQTSEVLFKLHHPALSGARPIAHVELVYLDAMKKETVRSDRQVTANFTADRHAVEASLDAATFAKEEQVATAEAVKTAMDAYASGNKDQARQVIAARRAAIAAAPAPAAAAPMMEKATAGLQMADDAVEGKGEMSQGYGGAAGMNAAAKKAKESVRSLSR